MKKLAYISLIIGFSGIAVFGFIAMGHNGDHAGCIAATVQGGDCPENNVLDSLAFHANVFRGFSSAVFGELPIIALTVLWLTVFLSGLVLSLGRDPGPNTFNFDPPYVYGRRIIQPQFFSWLSFHENSPNFS